MLQTNPSKWGFKGGKGPCPQDAKSRFFALQVHYAVHYKFVQQK